MAETSGADFLMAGDKCGLPGIGHFGITRIVSARQRVQHLNLSKA
jgi:hypothetical protein